MKSFFQIREQRELLLMAGQSAERQETGFVDAVNNAYEFLQSPITLVSKDATIHKVVSAEKFSGRSAAGTEPYTDVIITLESGKKINVSMKGPSAPSLAGGGLAGIELVIPGIGKKFMQAALSNHIRHGLKFGDKVPDTYAKLNDRDKMLLVIGNKQNGGPIDFMYIGPMDVKSDLKNGRLVVNGSLIDSKKYAKSHDLYFRLRARREDQTFDPNAKDSKGIPTVYGRSPSKGDNKGRIVVTDSVPKARGVITF